MSGWVSGWISQNNMDPLTWKSLKGIKTYSYTLCAGVGVLGSEEVCITLLLFDVVLWVIELLEPVRRNFPSASSK